MLGRGDSSLKAFCAHLYDIVWKKEVVWQNALIDCHSIFMGKKIAPKGGRLDV